MMSNAEKQTFLLASVLTDSQSVKSAYVHLMHGLETFSTTESSTARQTILDHLRTHVSPDEDGSDPQKALYEAMNVLQDELADVLESHWVRMAPVLAAYTELRAARERGELN